MKEAKIEMTHNRKLYLLPDDGKIKKKVDFGKKPTITINVKFGMITFGRHASVVLCMEKKFIKFYYDEHHKVIAWKLRDRVSQEELRMGWKLCRQDPTTKMIQFSIKRLMYNFNIPEGKKSYKGLEVKKYRDYTLLGSFDFYYYVDVK